MALGGAKATSNWASIFRVGMKATSFFHPCFPTVLQPGNQHPFRNINFASIFPGKMDVGRGVGKRRNIQFTFKLSGKTDAKWMLGGGPEVDVHWTSIFGQPQQWMPNPASILHKRRGGGGSIHKDTPGHGSQARLPIHRRYPLPTISCLWLNAS